MLQRLFFSAAELRRRPFLFLLFLLHFPSPPISRSSMSSSSSSFYSIWRCPFCQFGFPYCAYLFPIFPIPTGPSLLAQMVANQYHCLLWNLSHISQSKTQYSVHSSNFPNYQSDYSLHSHISQSTNQYSAQSSNFPKLPKQLLLAYFPLR